MIGAMTYAEAMQREAPYATYVCKAGDGTVLYVGFTGRGFERMAEHMKRPWWIAVETITFDRFETEQEARASERELIAGLFPLFNVQGRPPGPPATLHTIASLLALLDRKDADIAALRSEFDV